MGNSNKFCLDCCMLLGTGSIVASIGLVDPKLPSKRGGQANELLLCNRIGGV